MAARAGDDGGLLGVLLLLARDERAAAGPVSPGPADLHLGAIDAQGYALGGSVGEDVGQRAQPQAGVAGGGAATGREQRADLMDGPGRSEEHTSELQSL